MFSHRFLTLVPAVLAAAMLASAAENEAQENTAPGSGERSGRNFGSRRSGPGGMGGAMMESFRKAQEEIKAKLPAEYAEYEKLQSSDRRAAMSKFRELASKAGVELPMMGRGGNRRRDNGGADTQAAANAEWQKVFEQLKAKFPTEFAEIEKLLETDSAAALKKLQALAAKAEITLPEVPLEAARKRPVSIRNSNRLYIRRANRMLERLNPEAYAELEKLRSEDEDAAREKFRTMVKQAGITLERLRAGAPGEDAGVTVIKQDDSAVNSTAVSSSRRSSGSSWGGGHPGGFPPHGDFGGGMPPPPPGM